VSALEVVALLLVVGLAGYLVAALLYPQRFQ
jgi:K+-transporting ATPase KdpF subunit